MPHFVREKSFHIYFQFGEKSAKNWKKWKKNQKKFFITLFAKNIQSEKNFEITFSLKRRLHKRRKINETMEAIFGLGHEIYELKLKRTKKFFGKK